MRNKSSKIFSLCMLLVSIASAMTAAHASETTMTNGLILTRSNHSVSETIDRLEAALLKKGMTIFKRVPVNLRLNFFFFNSRPLVQPGDLNF